MVHCLKALSPYTDPCAVSFHDIQNHLSSLFSAQQCESEFTVVGESLVDTSFEQSLIREIILRLFRHNADPASKDVSAA